MAQSWLTKSSFYFGDTNMWDTYGLQIADDGQPKDVLIPNLRARKMTIPNRSGAYDFGAEYYDERQVSVTCVTTRVITREQALTMAYMLSKKAPIRFWSMQNRHYYGRIYQAPSLEMLRNIGVRFTLTFVCDPFIYGSAHTLTIGEQTQAISYAGTAPTPVLITLENLGGAEITGITIIQRDEVPDYIVRYDSGFEIVNNVSSGTVIRQTVCSMSGATLLPGRTAAIDGMAYTIFDGEQNLLKYHSGSWIDKLNCSTTSYVCIVTPSAIPYTLKMTWQDRYL